MMYIRRKVFSILDTEIGERLFSTTDYILDQREFAGETKRRNKALKRQWLEKMGQEVEKGPIDMAFKRIKDNAGAQFGQKGAGNVHFGRKDFKISQGHDDLAFKERIKRNFSPEEFKDVREITKREYMNKKSKKPVPQSPKPTTPNPEVVVVPEKALVVSNPKPVIKTESKLSRLAKNKYAQAGAGLLALGGIGYGVHRYIKNKNKGEEDRTTELENNSND